MVNSRTCACLCMYIYGSDVLNKKEILGAHCQGVRGKINGIMLYFEEETEYWE